MTHVVINKNAPTVYGFDAITNAAEVSNLIDSIRTELGAEMNKKMIYVLSGTHGDEHGNLTGERVFFMEDKSKELQTVKAVNVNQSTPPNTWKSYFGKSNSILILAWCFSKDWNGLSEYLK